MLPRADAVAQAEQAAAVAARALRRELAREWRAGQRSLHPRFEGGLVALRSPGGAEVRRFPIEQLFRRLCHVKGALARLEEALDAQEGFTPEERDGFQRQLRGIEGSFTTFNLLFRERSEGFQGTGQKP